MTRVVELYRTLPWVARWGIVAGILVLLGAALGAGAWAWRERREARAREALELARDGYRVAIGSGQTAQLSLARETLDRFLKEYAGTTYEAEAWYLLGNLEYERRAYDAAIEAYRRAMARGRPTVSLLARLGTGYAWESKGDLARAHQVYSEALRALGPRDFLYAELMLARARTEEGLTRRTEAVATYRKLLADAPGAPQAEVARGRLAFLGPGSP